MGSLQNKFSVKVGILSQRGGRGSEPIPTFINHCFYGIFDPFLPGKFTVKIPTFEEKGGGASQLGQNPNFNRKLVLKAPLISTFVINDVHL